ncbi:MAG: M20/M25/M40 family metallo-hydrolase [Parvibaculaceae bacterium]
MANLGSWSIDRDAVKGLIGDICAIGNRFVGTAGEAKARRFVEERFRLAGLHDVRCEPVEILNYEPQKAVCEVAGSSKSFRCVGLQYTASASVEAEALYLGRPTSLDDLEAMERRLPPLAGKVAILHSYWPWLFADHLIARGVAAIVVISETPGGTISHLSAQLYPVNPGPAFEGRPLSVPGVTMDRDDGGLLVGLIASGETRLRVVHEADYKPVKTANVIGEIKGEGSECIVLGAHYDTQFEGEGAQDNATGLGALIAIAERWATAGDSLHRTVKFVAFCAEEQGMWGATEYCRSHAGELGATVAMVNMDALAWGIRGQRALLADPSIADYAEARAREIGWPVEITTNASLLRAADLNPFIDSGVPACWFWLFPPQHPYYHSAGDVIALLDIDAVAEVANVAAYMAHCLASDRSLDLGRAVGLPDAVAQPDGSDALARLDERLEQLRRGLSVMRVTLRLDVAGKNFPALGESVAEGAASIRQDESLDQRGAATAQWVMRNRKILVQPDFTTSGVDAPGPLIKAYGVKAQMLAPVLSGGEVVGWVSIHSARPRDWTAADEKLATIAANQCAADLDLLADAVRAKSGWTLVYRSDVKA